MTFALFILTIAVSGCNCSWQCTLFVLHSLCFFIPVLADGQSWSDGSVNQIVLAGRLSRFTIHMRTFILFVVSMLLVLMHSRGHGLTLSLVHWWHWQWQWQPHHHRLSPPFECIQCWLGAEMWCDEMRCCLQKKERKKMMMESCCAQVPIRQ